MGLSDYLLGDPDHRLALTLCHPGGTFTWKESCNFAALRMFLLPSRLRDMLEKRRPGIMRRVFSKDERLVRTVRELAVTQRRAEQEVYNDIIESGMKALNDTQKYQEIWGRLSVREQQVAALTCLGYRSYEIAVALGISYETVRSHSKHIYAKFGLNRTELRQALQQWNFEAWWEDHQD